MASAVPEPEEIADDLRPGVTAMSRLIAPSRPSRSISRRRVIGAGASVLMLGSRPGARAQDTPDPLPKRPHPEPSSRRDAESWFLISRPAEPGFITHADRFEVYDGRSFELLGGFPSADTWSVGVTGNPARILLDTMTGPSIFDLDTGNLAQITWDVQVGVGSVRLPDPRWAAPTPVRWSFFTDADNGRALLVDLDHATGVDLAETLVKAGETAAYPTLQFAPDGTRAIASVAYNGFYLLDPEAPDDARLLDGGLPDMVSWGPDFSPDSSRIAYVMRPASGDPEAGRLVIEDLGNGDIIEIGPVGPEAFAVFPPDSGDDLIVFDGGTVSRREVDGGREVWRAESGDVVLALGVTGNALFLGSTRGNSASIWQTIDLRTGESLRRRELDGLTYYNGSYVNPEPAFQLMGPPWDSDEDITGRLAAMDLATDTLVSLLDETSGWSLSLSYATSQDIGILLYAPSSDGAYRLFDLERSDMRVFRYDPGTTSPYDPAVSADGTTASITLWDNSGSGRMEAWLLDVATGGEPEPFMEGRLWRWAGGSPASTVTASHPVVTTAQRHDVAHAGHAWRSAWH